MAFPLHAQDAPNNAADAEVGPLQYPNNPVGDILSLYEKLTGKVLERDASLVGAPNLSIVATKKIPASEAVRLIEASLLLNGYSLIPDSGDRVKVLYTQPKDKNPRSEGVPLYDNASAIPPGNQVVSYFMPLHFIASSEAAAMFQQHIALHSYGQITEVPNAHAVVITENASLIRELISLQELVDVPPVKMTSEFITLKRADAERVAETITKMIEAEKNDRQKRGGQPQAGNAAAAGGGADESYESGLVSGSVQLIADARTNRILVVTRPTNFAFIKGLIAEFDEATDTNAPLERPLKYISAAEVLPVLADLLQAGETEKSASGQGGQGAAPVVGQSSPRSTPEQTSTFNANAMTSGTSGNSHPDILSEPQDTGPSSIIIGKTHLIADNKANSILVIGPPESQEKVRTILDRLDKRPPQVYLSTVIGQLQLLNNDELGVNYVKLFQSSDSTRGSDNGVAASAITDTLASLINTKTLTAASAFPATGGLSLYGTIGKNLTVYVRALESTNRFKVLSRPAIFTANNKKAVISSGQKVPFPTSTLTNIVNSNNNNAAVASNIDYEDVVLKLEVIPLINANNEVNLKIAQVDDSISGSQTISGNTVPTISTQQITTTVTVPNGNTVVLGGLITENTSKDVTGIPVLMHLPWVGPAFRTTTNKKERDELIIFIQPTVVDSDASMVNASNGETNRAQIGPPAYDFSKPAVLPQTEMNAFFPVDSKTKDKKPATQGK